MQTTLPVKFESTPNTIIQAIHMVVQHTDQASLSLSEVMGYTSHAFRINVRPQSIETDSPYTIHGGEAMRRGFRLLGYNTQVICPPVKTITSDMLTDIIHTIRHSLDRGFPVVAWNMFAVEFGVIYGYDDSRKVLFAMDNSFDGPIPYDQLPNRRVLALCVMDQPIEIGRRERLKETVAAILDHAYSRDGLAWDQARDGLRGYDAWIDAFNGGKISNKGNALNLHLLADARRHAVAFLELMSAQWDDGTSFGTNVSRLAKQAAVHYADVLDNLGELTAMYPYPLSKRGANPRQRENVPRSIELLGRAREAEVQGIAVLNEIYGAVNK
ncbi:hypothetical protein PCCS19_39270 [Paenibacillus sp. CCS19]|uniref:hypothetical protein n=1 Tax=Paenibacillus sp. CCS19 TaxID=3158387 RepID=UPI00255DE9FC|nr:hypothetical protein [Paenibacillus cellulosilyticus]GMK40871.1 hypothetical protein PCCS19_39270 [Paenibacillus cellulosilyticus]